MIRVMQIFGQSTAPQHDDECRFGGGGRKVKKIKKSDFLFYYFCVGSFSLTLLLYCTLRV